MNNVEPSTAGPAPAGTTVHTTTGAGDQLPFRVLLAYSSEAQERQFVDHYVAFYFRYAQASLLLGLLLVLGDFGIDYLDHPALQANFLRLQVCVPVLLLGLAYSFSAGARMHWQAVMSGFIVTMASTLFWILLRIDAEGGAGLATWVGILNFTFLELYCFVILGVQFRYALVAGLLIVTAFEWAMVAHSGLPTRAVVYWSYHVVTLFLLIAGIGWWREYLLRMEFSARTSLVEARAFAEHLARTKGDFLATMSHELRTPMNGVLGMTELLLDSRLSDTQRRHAQTIRSSGEALLTILNDVLDLSRIEAGRVALDPIALDPRDLGEEALQLLSAHAQTKGLELAWQVGPGVPALVRADPTRLRQVLLNLLGNAIKFSDAGEVTLALVWETDPAVAEAPGHGLLRFSVSDAGIGIGKEAQARLFQPFEQADRSTTRRYGGTGLGLAVCKQLTEIMGGTIGVDSEPGRGSTFWFTARVEVLDAGAPAAKAELRSARVLVVDPHPARCREMQDQVEAMGALCTVAAERAVALEALRAAAAEGRPFRVAIVEATLADASGRALLQAVRDDVRLRDTALVLTCSLAEANSADASRLGGADRVLSRPVRRSDLADTLASLCATVPAAADPVGPAPARLRLRGRILLVEDNATNRAVASALLQRLGVTVELAGDGTEAVALFCDAAREHAFDAVLMDCQMPVMDGFEATRRIRAWELGRGHGQATPIVALTANAMAGDRQTCLAAGMTDYLSKPFTGAQLGAMLQRHLPRDGEGPDESPATPPAPAVPHGSSKNHAPPAADSSPADAAALPVFDPAILQSLPMVLDGTEPDFAAEVLQEFLRGSDAAIDECRRAQAHGDRKTALRCMHTLKSGSGQVGALALAALAGELETRMRQGEALDKTDMARVRLAHSRVTAAIRSHGEAGAAALEAAP